jgi:predicted nucleotidyltransferase
VARTIHEAGGRDIRVFGSVARGEDTPQSDVDLLVRLPDPMGMIALVGLEQALEDLLGVPVHIVDDWGDGRVLAEAREQAVAL